ncbi:PIG-L deacetylase family protein [Rhodopseudomonas palustris]|uniref:PIG-L family deacetylase n=1 Tax=Rhodopseudomonas palustris TaxID=1076 RepID=A0A418VDE5_RHOPL|nr:PIG-L deacetylase family protein [Rhodopseudomonas palustris]RJF74173.1 PIG-L family deacetylase [Rhodopseudomonas palustris]
MRAADYFDAIRRLPIGALSDITAGEPCVVLSPHPDDESLGAGGLIAAACDAGQRVEVVLITDGGASHPNSPSYPRQRLIELRRAELEQAAALLGLPPDHVHRLGLPDTQAPTEGPPFDAAVNAIAAVCARAAAKSLLVTWDGDPHCDHQATARIAEAVCRRHPEITLWAFPIWGWHLDPAEPLHRPAPEGLRLDISAQQARKRAAIDAHASQMTDLIGDDPDGFRFTEQTLAPFVGRYEHYLRVPR